MAHPSCAPPATNEQIADLSDRVLVLAAGAVVAELEGPAVTRERIASACHTAALGLRDPG